MKAFEICTSAAVQISVMGQYHWHDRQSRGSQETSGVIQRDVWAGKSPSLHVHLPPKCWVCFLPFRATHFLLIYKILSVRIMHVFACAP